MARIRTIALGVAGVGPEWSAQYQPALERLAHRLHLVGVYDCCPDRAVKTAQALNTAPCLGLRELISQGLDGLIVGDTSGWQGFQPVWMATRYNVPVAVQLTHPLDCAEIEALDQHAARQGLFIVPELRARHFPSTLRLRELIATELGPVEHIEINSLSRRVTLSAWAEAQLWDWAATILDASLSSVRWTPDPRSSGNGACEATFTHRRSGRNLSATLAARFAPSTPQPASAGGESPDRDPPPEEWPVEFVVRCKDGEARTEGPVHLRWRLGGIEHDESLGTDRSAVAVELDHFARRLAGGLIPVPGLSDVLRAMHMQNVAATARQTDSAQSEEAAS